MGLKKIALIPARYASTRLPGKMLQDLCGAPLIVRTYEAALKTALFDEVAVVCDDERIARAVEKHNGKAIMSEGAFSCGTDRIASVVDQFSDADLVVNIQGDEPFTQKSSLSGLLAVFEKDCQNEISVASLMFPLKNKADIDNPNYVKVVVDHWQNALLFSRSVIPFPRTNLQSFTYFKHIGIYAFRRDALKTFAALPLGKLEAMEQLENLRLLENAIPIRMVETPFEPISIDTEADLENARQHFISRRRTN